MAVRAVFSSALVDSETALVDPETALGAAHSNEVVVGSAAVALGIAEGADKAAQERCDAVAVRLGYLTLEQWGATVAAAHGEYPAL